MRVKSLAERDMITSRCETCNIQSSPQIMSSLVRSRKIKGQLCHRREWSISSKDSQSRTQNSGLRKSKLTPCSVYKICISWFTLLKHTALLCSAQTHCWIESTAASRDQATSRPAQPLETKTTWNDKTVSCDIKEPHLQVRYFRDLLWHGMLIQTTL